MTAQQASELLSALGRFDEAIAAAVGCPDLVIMETNDSGRPERALDLVADPSMRRFALMLMGEPERALAMPGPDDEEALVAAGRGEEIATRAHPRPSLALIATGRLEAVFDDPSPGARRQARLLADRLDGLAPEDVDEGPPMLMGQHRYDRCLALYGEDVHWGMWPRDWFALDAWIAGDRAKARALFAIPPGWRYRQSTGVPILYAIEPLLRESDGETGVFAALRDELATHRYAYRQVPWYLVRYVLGEIDDAGFRARPFKRCLDADLAWATAIKADRGGDAARATAAYAAWLATPRWARETWPDPVTERFARWRIARLTPGR